MKTIILDDDPTGTQSASHVTVVLECSVDELVDVLRHDDAVYVQTNSRAIDEAAAVALVTSIRDMGVAAGEALGERVRFVLRGDSTLRGHVFAETEVFLNDDAVMVFVPAFPAGGRTTRDNIHLVQAGGRTLPAHETEYADDPVFPFRTGVLNDYVREKSSRAPLAVSLLNVRAGSVFEAIRNAAPGAVVVPDAVNDDDVRMIAAGIVAAEAEGRTVVVRCAAPLAAALAGVQSEGLLDRPLVSGPVRVLLACGSHTAGATSQLARFGDDFGAPVVISTDAALTAPAAAGRSAAAEAAVRLESGRVTSVSTERTRQAEHNTLSHGEAVMTALTTAVRELVPHVDVVVAKGGITSAELAHAGVGATRATVLGQVSPGVSVWQLESFEHKPVLYVVVPGNVGDSETLVDVMHALGLSGR
ncbi:four-carbon acid sugar kinase family protein [Microbacterium sp. HA-8]|uniref:four-carbon acid sugar kinase family protein n=1 Tax=Microbacterium sp. HA-8 TaxID=3234200 RepID=UPI0038F6A86F